MTSSVESIRLTATELAAAGEDANAVLALRRLLVVAQRLRQRLDDRFRQAGLTAQQAVLLSIARDRDGPSLAEVAQAMGCSHQNVRQLVNALTRKGHLVLETDPEDRRARRLVPTTQGLAFWSRRDPEDFQAVGDWFTVLTRQEQADLSGLLDSLLRGLDRSD